MRTNRVARAEIERLRDALDFLIGGIDREPWIATYRAAGGGYEGLQAVAREALDASSDVRSPQGEDHEEEPMHPDGERTAAWAAAQERNHARRAQGESHEAGIESAAQALIRLHSVFEPSDNNFAWVVARHAVRAYLSRVSAPKSDENQEASQNDERRH